MNRLLIICLTVFFTATANAQDIYLTRHYEKASGNNPELTSQGKARANMLKHVLADTPIKAIFTTDYLRTTQTVRPLADALALPLKNYNPTKLPAFARQLLQSGETVLVAGHSNTTPELIRLLGGPDVAISESDYGTLFKLSVKNGSTTMTMVEIPPDQMQE